MEKITLVCTSNGENPNLLLKMLDSAKGFDEMFVHHNGITIKHAIKKINEFDQLWDVSFMDYRNHLSIPDAYNMIIDKVKTEWVCCFCDDDYFYPEGLTKMIAEIHKGCSAGIAHYKYRISGYRPPQDLRSWILGKTYNLCEKQYITEDLLRKHNRLPAGSFFRKDVWKAIGGFQGNKFHDHDFWLRAVKAGFTFKYHDHLVYEHVRRPNSAWVKQNA